MSPYNSVMRRAGLILLVLLVGPADLRVGTACFGADVSAQRRRAPARKPAPLPPLTSAPAKVTCPELLGPGVKSGAAYCFVLAASDPARGVTVAIPPHAGPATLSFDLHNRHTYSEEDVKARRGFASYTAVIAVVTMTGTLLGRGAVQSEFRTARDLHERIAGGAGPGGVKAVAPLGREEVIVTIPAAAELLRTIPSFCNVTPASLKNLRNSAP